MNLDDNEIRFHQVTVACCRGTYLKAARFRGIEFGAFRKRLAQFHVNGFTSNHNIELAVLVGPSC